jgi:hypothetical protein
MIEVTCTLSPAICFTTSPYTFVDATTDSVVSPPAPSDAALSCSDEPHADTKNTSDSTLTLNRPVPRRVSTILPFVTMLRNELHCR